jgi:hypothetical protein
VADERRQNEAPVATVTLAADGILGLLRESAAHLGIVLEGDLSSTQFEVMNIVIGRLEGAASMVQVLIDAR